MNRTLRNLSMMSLAACSLWAADAQRGAVVLEVAGCLECHTVNGQGIGHEPNATAPELGSSLVPAYTAPALAAAVWNHTPSMLADMTQRRLGPPALTASDWEDLFAYLYSVQFLQFPAQVRRGKETFESKQCASCHSLTKGTELLGTPVASWRPVEDPVALVGRMWNHASNMDAAGREAQWTSPGWTKMNGRDFMDLTVYIQQVQGQFPESHFTLPDPALGKPLFDQNCGRCHSGPLALETELTNTTWMDIGAGMWNHVPLMERTPGKMPALDEQDMRKILAYVWELQYRGPQGDTARGEQTFWEKGCYSCHGSRGAGKARTPAAIAAAGWGEGRKMHEQMEKKGFAWPYLSAEEMGDVAAYLVSISGR